MAKARTCNKHTEYVYWQPYHGSDQAHNFIFSEAKADWIELIWIEQLDNKLLDIYYQCWWKKFEPTNHKYTVLMFFLQILIFWGLSQGVAI